MTEGKNQDAKPANWFMRHKVITGLLVFFAFGIIGTAMSNGNTNTSSNPTPPVQTPPSQNSNDSPAQQPVQPAKTKSDSPIKQEPAPTTQAQVEQPAGKSYQQIYTFSGNGAKNSEPFTITGSRFKITYDCAGDYCGAFLKDASTDSLKEVIMNATQSVKDETIIYSSGQYYIQANTVGSYTFTVFDYK